MTHPNGRLNFAAKRPWYVRRSKHRDMQWEARVYDRNAFYRIIDQDGLYVVQFVLMDSVLTNATGRRVEPVAHTEYLSKAQEAANLHNRRRFGLPEYPTERIVTDIPSDVLKAYQELAANTDTTVMELIVRAMRAGLIMSRNSTN